VDTDQALKDRGLMSTRFVDDFRLLLEAADSPYDALGFLAEQLGINEGLSLNSGKTFVLSRRDYSRDLEAATTDIGEEAEGVALDALTAELYFDEEPDEKQVEQLKGLNLVEMLKNAIEVQPWDMGRIKVIFRALKITKPKEAIIYIREKFGELTVFAKEICLLMEVLEDDSPSCFDKLLDEVIEAILTPPASSVQVIRTWLLEIFVRGIIEIPVARLKELETLPAVIDKRQLLLIRGRCNDKNHFRKQKAAVHSLSGIELSCLVWGAACLPQDEYENWIDTVKGSFNRPLGKKFLKWAKDNRTKLTAKLKAPIMDHPD